MILGENVRPQTKKSFETLEEDFNKVHNFKYNYENFVYINGATKSKITCKIHGDFDMRAGAHLQGKGCPTCKKTNGFYTWYNNQEKIKTKDIVFDINKKIEFECNCGNKIKTTPKQMLRAKKKCPVCYISPNIDTKDEFIKKAKKKHLNRYDYSNVKINGNNKVQIICKKHGEFEQYRNEHLRGNNCPICANTIRNSIMNTKWFNKPTALYYIKITKDKETVWKIGVTIHVDNILKRFSKEKNLQIEIIDVEYFLSGKYAYEKEQKIIDENVKYKYYGNNILSSGNTELFYKNIRTKK